MKVTLVFDKNGKNAHLIFEDNSKSEIFNTKSEAVQAICGYFEEGKIEKYQFKELLSEVLTSESLPNGQSFVFFEIEILEVVPFEKEPAVVNKIPNPYVEMCEGCRLNIPHAYIYDSHGNRISRIFLNKADGLDLAEGLFLQDLITEGDSAQLKTLINMLPLMDSAESN